MFPRPDLLYPPYLMRCMILPSDVPVTTVLVDAMIYGQQRKDLARSDQSAERPYQSDVCSGKGRYERLGPFSRVSREQPREVNRAFTLGLRSGRPSGIRKASREH